MRRRYIVAARRAPRTCCATASAPPENHGGLVTSGWAPGTERCLLIPKKNFNELFQLNAAESNYTRTHGTTRYSVAAISW